MDSRYATLPKADESKLSSTEIYETDKKPAKRSRLSWLWTLITQFLGFLWVAPIILLLYFNFAGYIIGPSASCPASGCKADPLATGNSNWALKLDHNDHNTLGALQIVAKVLELWFLFVAISLVYNLAMILASREGGLPLGLLSSPVEFADPRSLLEIFRAASPSPGQRALRERAILQVGLYLFVSFLAILCVLVNLMGPAVAVLVLPTLQWIDLPKHADFSFDSSNAQQLRNGDIQISWYCFDSNVTAREYSCTTIPYASNLDSWDDSVVASDSQWTSEYSISQSSGISPEGDVFFTFNSTVNRYDVSWAPSRQALREISSDLDFFEAASKNLSLNPSYHAYNSSLNTLLKRKGPIMGANYNNYWPENVTRITVGEDKEVNCYANYSSWIAGNGNYTKCLRKGTGWNPLNKEANFEVVLSQPDDYERVSMNVFFSDTAAFFNDTLNPGLIPPACFVNGTIANPKGCDWDHIFSANQPENSSIIANNILSVELTMPFMYPGQTAVFEFFTFANFSTYTLDTSPQTNPLYLVQVDSVPDPQKDGLRTVPVDPDWFLAAWSVDQGGLVANRSAALSLIRILETEFGSYSFDNATLEDTSGNETSSTTNSDRAFRTSSADSAFTSAADSSSAAKATGRKSSETGTAQLQNVRRQAVSTTPPSSASGAASSSAGWPPKSTSLTPESDEQTGDIDEFYLWDPDDDVDRQNLDLANFVFYSHLQALSMVTYNKQNLTQVNTDTKDPQKPTLWNYAQVHVWGYGTSSRTSKLGLVVTIMGCVCVIAATVLGVVSKRRQRSLTELLVAAIEHKHQGELNHAQGDEGHKARTRFRIHESDHDERVRFKPL